MLAPVTTTSPASHQTSCAFRSTSTPGSFRTLFLDNKPVLPVLLPPCPPPPVPSPCARAILLLAATSLGKRCSTLMFDEEEGGRLSSASDSQHDRSLPVVLLPLAPVSAAFEGIDCSEPPWVSRQRHTFLKWLLDLIKHTHTHTGQNDSSREMLADRRTCGF